MGFLERMKVHGDVPVPKIEKPKELAKPDLANPDKVYATIALEGEGILRSVVAAVKRHMHKHPTHHVEVDVTTTKPTEGEEQVNPVVKISLDSPDPASPTGWVKSGVNVVSDVWSGAVRIIHSAHLKHHEEDQDQAEVWKKLKLTPREELGSLDEPIHRAMSEASGSEQDVVELSYRDSEGQIGTGKE
ncbi:MAG TPA: hypothetical protein VNA13_00785 [Xanthomonadales bacterium]|nr:hypothetical protein [Xanthomonadales bacterium]